MKWLKKVALSTSVSAERSRNSLFSWLIRTRQKHLTRNLQKKAKDVPNGSESALRKKSANKRGYPPP
nr:MAG TPA: hypothetical protein [Caudoviricetes sp.]